MISKHNQLTEQEFLEYSINPSVKNVLKKIEGEKGKIKILDWGCGRGRSVLRLLEDGYDAYGIEIDNATMENGFDLFRTKGYTPENKLFHINKIKFREGYFDLIFSEQVLEHVNDLKLVVSKMAVLTKPSGIGFHVFPGSFQITEPHIFVPFVHWLPKGTIQRLYLRVILGKKFPGGNWPEVENLSILEKSKVFGDYLNQKTFYRRVSVIKKIFNDYNFDFKSSCPHQGRKMLPNILSKNGFPRGDLRVEVVRK